MKHTLTKTAIISTLILAGVTSVMADNLYRAGTTRATVGDCYADRTGSDVIRPADPYCIGTQATATPKDRGTLVITATDQPTIIITVTATPDPTNTPDPTATPDPVTPVPDDKPKHPNKGEGNGGEGSDPGNNPDKGNNDED